MCECVCVGLNMKNYKSESSVFRYLYTPIPRVLTGCYDNTVYVWNHDGGLLLSLDGHGGPVKDVKWVEGEDPRHSVFLSGSQDQYIYVWKVPSYITALCQEVSQSTVHLIQSHLGAMLKVFLYSTLPQLALEDIITLTCLLWRELSQMVFSISPYS